MGGMSRPAALWALWGPARPELPSHVRQPMCESTLQSPKSPFGTGSWRPRGAQTKLVLHAPPLLPTIPC